MADSSTKFFSDGDKKVQFFRIPMAFQELQSQMTNPEKDVLIYFFIQATYRHSLVIHTTNEHIRLGTGIANPYTVTKAIQGLANHGWIGNIEFQRLGGNKYHINLIPKVNQNLLDLIAEYGRKMSKSKKRSIKMGESGKFASKDREGSSPT